MHWIVAAAFSFQPTFYGCWFFLNTQYVLHMQYSIAKTNNYGVPRKLLYSLLWISQKELVVEALLTKERQDAGRWQIPLVAMGFQ